MLCLNPITGLVLAIFICHGIYFSNRCSCQNISLLPILVSLVHLVLRVCLVCYSGSLYVHVLVHFIVLIVPDLFFSQWYITVVHLFFSCHSEYCWVALSLRKAFFGRPDQWRNRWECKFMSVCSEYVCIQSESWATVSAFDHVRIACSLIEFDFHYMVFTSGLISYSTRCVFFFWSLKLLYFYGKPNFERKYTLSLLLLGDELTKQSKTDLF